MSVGGVRWRSYDTECSWCGAVYRGTSSQKFCEDCVHGDQKQKMRERQNIALYGVDHSMHEAMYFEQDGKCMICNDREATAIDHCHKTNRVRGLLCLGCNTLLGFMETQGRLEAALTYQSEGVY